MGLWTVYGVTRSCSMIAVIDSRFPATLERVKWKITDEYSQKQWIISMKTIHEKNVYKIHILQFWP